MNKAILAVLLVYLIGLPLSAAEKPLRALLVTGGCCHDYGRQKQILSQGISARADVQWTIVHQGGSTTDTKIPLYEDENWSRGFDVVVHNECFAGVQDKAFVDRILKPHKAGLPAVIIHCVMHCYRTGDDRWFEFCGVQSPGHGPHYSFDVENVAPDDPIMKGFGDSWTAPKGELYDIQKVLPGTKPLGQAKRKSDGKPQVCVWSHEYGKGRVFGTTIGHYSETMTEPTYLDMVTRGLLWAAGRLDEKNFKPTTPAQNAAIRDLIFADPKAAAGKSAKAPAKDVPPNLASGKTVSASSEEISKDNFAKNAVDGKLSTRWCASGSGRNEFWQVDFGQPEEVKACRITWESDDTYQYKIDGSQDGKTWKPIVDASGNDQAGPIMEHQMEALQTRFMRVTFLGSKRGSWSSFWEFEAYAGDMPKVAGSPGSSGPDLTAPEGFNLTLFGVPPEVNYPVCIAAAPTGEVFVGVDEQGSLGKTPGGGRVLRCIDTDDDGVADQINVFAKMDHPRGLFYDNGRLWVLHPPTLSLYIDSDLDGVADEHQVLITGVSTEQNKKRGADHTTNGIRMGPDGWLYIAVGDYGMNDARGTDGSRISRRGGGILRCRPDGSDLEIYAWGLRNVLDLCLDPLLNGFTRDNTNDGGGWDIRFSHIMQSAEYGYPSRYLNFHEETMPPLQDYGGGSGCGAMYVQDLRWPGPYGNAVYTCDWGRSMVYRHNPDADGPSFKTHQAEFLQIPRPTDIDIDGSGRMYVSSWKDGGFAYSHPNVGYVAQLVPTDFSPEPFPNLQAANDAELINHLAGPSAVHRLHSQMELLRRGPSVERSKQIKALAADSDALIYGRVAAIFTLKQLDGVKANPTLLSMVKDPSIREWVLRVLTDRKSELANVPTGPFVDALSDPNPRVQAQALISLGRLGKPEVAGAILPFSVRSEGTLPTGKAAHAQPDVDRVLPHLAVRALVALEATEACLNGLQGPYRKGALAALRDLHNSQSVDGLIAQSKTEKNPGRRQELTGVLARLYFQEGAYSSDDWWGTRPDTSGPHYDRKTWKESPRIASYLKAELTRDNPEPLLGELKRHKINLGGVQTAKADTDTQQTVLAPKVADDQKNMVANLDYNNLLNSVLKSNVDPAKGEPLFTSQGCVICHTVENGQSPKGPHLADIGKRYSGTELIESILKPNAKIAQGFDTEMFTMKDGQSHLGFVVSESAEDIQIRGVTGLGTTLIKPEIKERTKQTQSMMPEGLADNLTPTQLAELLAYLQAL